MFGISSEVMAFVLAAISGLLMAVQGSLNSALGKVVGLVEAIFIVHVTGAVCVSVLLVIQKLSSNSGWPNNFFAAPWYTYLGGIVGVGIVYLVVLSIPKVGVANATTAIIVGQTLTAVAIDHFGAFGLDRVPCSWLQLLGLMLLAVGAKLLLRI